MYFVRLSLPAAEVKKYIYDYVGVNLGPEFNFGRGLYIDIIFRYFAFFTNLLGSRSEISEDLIHFNYHMATILALPMV